MPSSAVWRHIAALLSAATILLVPIVAQAQDADEGGEQTLILDTYLCGGNYADTISLSKCLGRQNAKADRWMAAIAESYARHAEEAMADLAHGGVPFDQVGQLRKAQSAFEAYRKEAALLAGRTGLYGSSAGIEEAMAYFALTVERARFLLDTCNHPRNSKLANRIDLTIADWCPPAL